MKQMKRALQNDDITKAILKLAIPIILMNLLQTAYQLVDAYWVGRLGADAVAAVSFSFPLTFLLIALGGGLSIAGTILIAQYKGKKDQEQVDHIAGQTMLMVVVVSIILSIIGYISAPAVLKLMGAEPSVLPGAISFLRFSYLGLVFVFGFFVVQSVLRGVGQVKVPVYIVLCSVILNFALDPFLIYGYGPFPALGVGGAALATLITECIAFIIGMTLLFGGKYGIHLRKRHLKPDFPLMKRMFLLGFPASIEQSARATGFIIMTTLVASFGTLIVASYGVGTRILGVVIIPALGMSMAVSTLVGQSIGAGNIERAAEISRRSIWLGFLILSAVGALIFLFARPLAMFFIDDPSAIQIGAQFIRIMALSFGFIGIQMSIIGTFRGAGETTVSMVLALISVYVLQFPLAYILSKHTALGATGIWWAFPISNIIAAFIAWAWYARGTWKSRRITEEMEMQDKVTKESMIQEGQH